MKGEIRLRQKLKHSADQFFFVGILLVPTFLLVASIVLVAKFGIEPLLERV